MYACMTKDACVRPSSTHAGTSGRWSKSCQRSCQRLLPGGRLPKVSNLHVKVGNLLVVGLFATFWSQASSRLGCASDSRLPHRPRHRLLTLYGRAGGPGA